MEVIVAITRQKKWHPGERRRQEKRERSHEHREKVSKMVKSTCTLFDLINGESRKEGQEGNKRQEAKGNDKMIKEGQKLMV